MLSVMDIFYFSDLLVYYVCSIQLLSWAIMLAEVDIEINPLDIIF